MIGKNKPGLVGRFIIKQKKFFHLLLLGKEGDRIGRPETIQVLCRAIAHVALSPAIVRCRKEHPVFIPIVNDIPGTDRSGIRYWVPSGGDNT